MVTALGLSGCKGRDEGGGAAPPPDPKAQKEQADLLARRDALLKTRQQIKDEQAKVEEQRRALAQQGGDTSELDKKAQELATQTDKLAADESQLLDQFERTLAELNTARAGADQASQVAAREGSMATREKQVASREAQIAAREAALADRERAQAVREKETCSAGAGTTTIIQQVDAKGSKYSKRDVEPLLKGARDAMSRKGLLASDLPAQVQGLEREATKAMGEGDYGQAFYAARSLAATIDATRIDRGFVSAKIARLSARMKGASLDGGKQKQVDDLFVEATTKYGDGDFGGANRKLNQIYGVVQ